MNRRRNERAAAPGAAGRTQRGIQSVEVGGRLLRALAEARAPLAAADLAASGGLPSSQAHAYLVSLTRLGLLKRDALSGRYEPGPLALRLGLLHLAQQPALREAVPRAAALAQALDCSVALCIAGPQGPTIVRYEHASLPLHVNLHVGTVMSLPGTSTGRVFCAYLAPDVLGAMWANQAAQPVFSPAHRGQLGGSGAGGLGAGDSGADDSAAGGPATSASGAGASGSSADASETGASAPDAALAATLATIRRRGFELAVDAPSPGVSSVAVPVLDEAGQLRLTLTAIGASGALDVQPDGAVVRALRAAASAITAAAFAAPSASPTSASTSPTTCPE